MISGAGARRSGAVEPRYLDAAARAAGFLLADVRVGGRLMRSFEDGRAEPPGYLEDHAFLAAGLFDLYESTLDAALAAGGAGAVRGDRKAVRRSGPRRLVHDQRRAREAARARAPDQRRRHPVRDLGGAHERAARRPPSPATTTGGRSPTCALSALSVPLSERPTTLTEALLALDYRTDAVREIAVVWPAEAGPAAAAPLLSVLRRTFLPNKVLAGGPEGDGLSALAAVAPFVEGKRALAGAGHRLRLRARPL